MTREEQAGDGFIDVPASGLQSSAPALELRGVRCRSGEQRGPACGEQQRGRRGGADVARGTRPALNTFWPVSPRTGHGGLPTSPLGQGPPALPPPCPVGQPCPASPDEAPGGAGTARDSWDTQACAQMEARCHPTPQTLSSCGGGSSLLLHSIHAGSVLGQEHSCPRLGQDRGARTSPWRTERELEPWARRWQRWGWRCQARAGAQRLW